MMLGLVSIVFFVAVGAVEQPFRCSNHHAFYQLDDRLLNCGQHRWGPLPYGYPDIRVCCHRLERECLYNKLVRSMCEVTGEQFDQEIQLRYDLIVDECKDIGLQVSEQVCAQQKTETLSDDVCNQFIPCSLNDWITWNPHPNPNAIPYPEYEPNDYYTERVDESYNELIIK